MTGASKAWITVGIAIACSIAACAYALSKYEAKASYWGWPTSEPHFGELIHVGMLEQDIQSRLTKDILPIPELTSTVPCALNQSQECIEMDWGNIRHGYRAQFTEGRLVYGEEIGAVHADATGALVRTIVPCPDLKLETYSERS